MIRHADVSGRWTMSVARNAAENPASFRETACRVPRRNCHRKFGRLRFELQTGLSAELLGLGGHRTASNPILLSDRRAVSPAIIPCRSPISTCRTGSDPSPGAPSRPLFAERGAAGSQQTG